MWDIYIYIYMQYICNIYIYICNHKNNVPSRLSPQWPCGNPCSWAHDVRLGNYSSLAYVMAFFSIKLPSIGMFWLRFDKNYRNTTLSSFSKSLSLNFRFLLEQLSSKALKYFSLFLIQVEIVLGWTPYFLEASLLDRPFSMSTLFISVFSESFLFNTWNQLHPEAKEKN